MIAQVGVAMLDVVRLGPSDRVLNVATGSGLVAAAAEQGVRLKRCRAPADREFASTDDIFTSMLTGIVSTAAVRRQPPKVLFHLWDSVAKA